MREACECTCWVLDKASAASDDAASIAADEAICSLETPFRLLPLRLRTSRPQIMLTV